MASQIIISVSIGIGVLAPLFATAQEQDLSTLIGQQVLQVLDERGSLTSASSFARDTLTTCADHRQAVSEMASRFQETGQAQSLLSMAQQAPAAAQEVRTRLATMMVDRLISQGQEALCDIVQDLEAEILFACYDGALRAAQNVPQPAPVLPSPPPDAETTRVQPEPLRPVAEPPVRPPSLAADPSPRPVLRPTPRVAEAAPPNSKL